MGRRSFNTYCRDIIYDTTTIDECYDIVLHAAAKAHSVPTTQSEKDDFFKVNFTGTVNLCKSLSINPPDTFIFLSTVAVYGCVSGINIDEDHPLEGKSAYAKSKILAEEYLRGWCEIKGVKLIILRPALLAGMNPPGNLGAMVHGIRYGRYFNIGKGDARKSIAMASDIARIVCSDKLIEGVYNLCDDTHPSFSELSLVISKQLGKKYPISVPLWIAKFLAIIGDFMGSYAPINTEKLLKIINPLCFSNDKIKKEYGFNPADVLENFLIE